MRRIIALADGTWQDAEFQSDPDMLTNISHLARSLLNRDDRTSPPIEQVKLYVPGIGTDEQLGLGIIQGAIGTGLSGKVREIYSWISLNYEVGDEIILAGFSRGAYTVRLVATLIGLIGILPPKHLHRFPALFDALMQRSKDEKIARTLKRLLKENEPLRQAQFEALGGGFSVKAVLCFDTVPVQSEPHEPIMRNLPIRHDLFGLPADLLEPHIEVALHALALDEDRRLYTPLLWRLDPTRLVEKQFLLQTWFSGCHTDVGGGYKAHDLGNLSLMWAVSHLRSLTGLAFDMDYLSEVNEHPNAPWGQLHPHHGFSLTKCHPRLLPSRPSPLTNEYIHESVLSQPLAHLKPATVQVLILHRSSSRSASWKGWSRRIGTSTPQRLIRVLRGSKGPGVRD